MYLAAVVALQVPTLGMWTPQISALLPLEKLNHDLNHKSDAFWRLWKASRSLLQKLWLTWPWKAMAVYLFPVIFLYILCMYVIHIVQRLLVVWGGTFLLCVFFFLLLMLKGVSVFVTFKNQLKKLGKTRLCKCSQYETQLSQSQRSMTAAPQKKRRCFRKSCCCPDDVNTERGQK